jgi:hypothetical protein
VNGLYFCRRIFHYLSSLSCSQCILAFGTADKNPLNSAKSIQKHSRNLFLCFPAEVKNPISRALKPLDIQDWQATERIVFSGMSETEGGQTDADGTADKRTTQTQTTSRSSRRHRRQRDELVQGYETQTTSRTSRRHRRQREELVQGYESLQSKDLNGKVRGHNSYE